MQTLSKNAIAIKYLGVQLRSFRNVTFPKLESDIGREPF